MFDARKIESDYVDKFGESLPIFYSDTETKYLGLLRAAEEAIKRGRKLTDQEAFKSMGMAKPDPKDKY